MIAVEHGTQKSTMNLLDETLIPGVGPRVWGLGFGVGGWGFGP